MDLKKKDKCRNGSGGRKPSQLETLKIYTDFRAFRRYMYRAIDKLPRWLKCSEGMECIHSIKRCIRCLSPVARSYDNAVKRKYMALFLQEWDVIFDSISFFYEVKGISNHQRNVMLRLRNDLEEQISAYQKWLSNNVQPPSVQNSNTKLPYE
ncbi:MAG: hypothetical protein E7108_01955 [Bacteroidales bacterium]|nr:hypothetical protein [Bacteroidales bacterium]